MKINSLGFTPVFLDENGKNIAISYQTSENVQDNPSFSISFPMFFQ
jgi:hypothetical protein